MDAAIALSLAGGIFELVGLVIVAVGIARDRKRAGKLLEPIDPPAERERQYPLPVPRMPASPSYPDRMFSSHDQITNVVERLHRSETAIVNAFLSMRKALDADLDTSVRAARVEAADRDRELRDHLRYILAGSVRDRWIGVGVLALGIALGVAGSVLAGS